MTFPECNRIPFCCKLLLLVILFLVLTSQVFGFYPFTLPNHMMVGRVMKTLFHVDQLSCIYECHMDENCFSCNVDLSKDGKGLCELTKCGVENNREREKSLIYTRGVLFQQIRPSQAIAKDGSVCWPKPDCATMRKLGVTANGIYSIDPDSKGPMNVSCDMTTNGGGWTVIQRRANNSTDFYQDWPSYKQGFGTLTGNLWLGNDNIHRLTASGNTVLQVELEDWDGNTAYAVYGTFEVDDESNKYRLTVGGYSGTAGDSLGYYNERSFTTKDQDNDRKSGANCAQVRTGAWWYKSCAWSNLNGKYLGNTVNWDGINWYHWKNNSLSLKRSVMMVRPSHFTLHPS